MSAPQDYETLARRLAQSPNHRVLRRVTARDVFAEPIGETKLGVLLDTETTGLDRREDQVIELAMIAFEFDDRGQVCRVRDRFEAFNDPGRPIPAGVVELTGITDDMVAGHAIDAGVVARIVGPAAVVIAHNAAFDRAVVQHISHDVAVMYLGQMVEFGPRESVFRAPQHPYTEALMASVPAPDPDVRTTDVVLSGEVPSPMNPPSGCRFHTRCPLAFDKCRSVEPQTREVAPGHRVACHLR